MDDKEIIENIKEITGELHRRIIVHTISPARLTSSALSKLVFCAPASSAVRPPPG